MSDRLSFRQVLTGVINDTDIAGIEELLLKHKNWGAFKAAVPSYIIVNLVDTLRILLENGAKYYTTSEGRPTLVDDFDREPTDEELLSGYNDELEDL